MSEIVSKNLYELLGNNHDEDSDKEPEPPVKVIDKTPARTTKRNAPAEAPASKVHVPTEGRGGRRGGYQGNEAAYRDRNAGSANNRVKSTDDGVRNDRFSRRGAYEGRVGAAGSTRTRGAREQDRHSRGVGGDSEKQANHGWGATEGTAELADENAGEEIAKAEQKEALTADGGPALADGSAEPEAEPEDNSISYEEYLAQLAEKKLALGSGPLEARKANEGSKQDKQWASAKPLAKDDEEDFVSGSGGKAKRERERKQKQVVDIDQAWNETAARAPSDRGGRGAFRGPRGDGPRGGFRGDRGGDRGRGGFRGDRGGSRGGDRGGRGRGGDARAPRGNSAGGAINTADQSAFPSLGGN